MTERVAKQKRFHYAWIVMIACCAMSGGFGALVLTAGQWYPPVTEELGILTSQFAVYLTIYGLVAAVAAPFVGKYLPRANVRVLLTVCYAIVIVAVFLMSQYNAVWQWYISGFFIGAAGCFVFIIPMPIILGNWFTEKRGFATGVAMSFSGVVAAIANPIVAAIIQNLGWRPAYMIIAIVSAVVILPCTMFLIRFKPADMGLAPYGVKETVAVAGSAAQKAAPSLTGVPAKRAYRSVAFWLMFLAVPIGFSYLAAYSQVLPQHMKEVDLAAIIGLISTMSMIGNFAGTLGLGALSDRIGGKRAGLLGIVIIMTGFIIIIFFGTTMGGALSGALLYGIATSGISVLTPLLCRAAFGDRDFASLYATMSIGIKLAGALGAAIIPLIHDLLNGYLPTFWIGAAVCIFMLIGITVSTKMARQLPHETDDAKGVETGDLAS